MVDEKELVWDILSARNNNVLYVTIDNIMLARDADYTVDKNNIVHFNSPPDGEVFIARMSGSTKW